MKILRIFLKGLQGNYCETQVDENMTMNSILQIFKMEGVICSQTPGMIPWAVPWDSWQFMAILTVVEPQRGPLAWDMTPPPMGEKPN